MVLNGSLKFLVLKDLYKKDKRCSEIVRSIEENTGWKVSPGSIYPLMKDLTERNLIELKTKNKSKIYSITLKGKFFLKKSDRKKKEIVQKIEESLKFLKIIGEESKVNEIKKRLKENHHRIFCEEFNKISLSLEKINLNKHHEKVKKILLDTINKLNKVK